MLNDAYESPIGVGLFYIGTSQTGRSTIYHTEGITAGRNNGDFMIEESNGVRHVLDRATARRLYPLSDAALTTVIEQGMIPVEWAKAKLPNTKETQRTIKRAEARYRKKKDGLEAKAA